MLGFIRNEDEPKVVMVKRLNLNENILAVEDLLRMSISKNVRLTFDLREELPDIEGDVAQLNQIFVNLVINASEAIGQNSGTIVLQTRSCHKSGDYFRDTYTDSDLGDGEYVVLTVRDIPRTVQFYESVLGMVGESFGKGRTALRFGSQKINLHEQGNECEPKAGKPTPGSGDLCFLTDSRLEAVMKHVESKGVEIIEGPVQRTGATGPIVSFYFRDPDQNLIEVANIVKNPR